MRVAKNNYFRPRTKLEEYGIILEPDHLENGRRVVVSLDINEKTSTPRNDGPFVGPVSQRPHLVAGHVRRKGVVHLIHFRRQRGRDGGERCDTGHDPYHGNNPAEKIKSKRVRIIL